MYFDFRPLVETAKQAGEKFSQTVLHAQNAWQEGNYRAGWQSIWTMIRVFEGFESSSGDPFKPPLAKLYRELVRTEQTLYHLIITHTPAPTV